MKKTTIFLLLICSFFIQIGFSQIQTATPFCSGTTLYQFDNEYGGTSFNPVGCLGSMPNPSYFYMVIDNPGDLIFYIEQTDLFGTPIDVDFIAWGPFIDINDADANILPFTDCPTCPNNTTNPTFYPYAPDNIVDCSFDIAPNETLTIQNAVQGEVYVILITNYDGDPGYITFQQTGGVGTTTCDNLPICGSNFYDTGGLPGNYTGGETETTTIVPYFTGGTVTVNFTAFDVDPSDILRVYDGPDATFPEIGTGYTGATIPGPFTSTDASGALTFVFTSDTSPISISSGWAADITCSTPPPPPTCGTNFYDIGGDSNNYLNNETTTTTIYPTVAGGTVTVDFTMFNVLAGDVLTVYDGPDATFPSLGNVTTAPSSFSSTNASGALTFVFTSNSSGLSSGWEANVSCTIPPTCSSFFYDSGGPTGNYSDDELITTTFFPDTAGDAVTVTFTLFDLEFADDLYVYDGPDATSPLLGVFNGTTIPGPFTSSHTTGALTFVFDSDFSVTYAGWEASISCAPYVPPPVCGTTFYDSGGASGNYANGQNQSTTLVPDIPGTVVTATFTAFNVESCCDELSIHDGPDATFPLLGTFAGTTLPPTFTSTHATGALTFVFTSDSSITRPGWAANITCTTAAPTCGDTFYDSGGDTGNYSDGENETTIISPITAGDAVTTTFTSFNLASGDTLEVFDGPTSLGVFTGNTIPGPFTSTDPSGELTFIFTSNSSGTQSGWAADVTCSILCNMSITQTLEPIGANDCTLNYSQLVATSAGSPGGTATIFSENFNGAGLPTGWNIANGAASAQWIISNSSNAGGTANEAMLDWTTGSNVSSWSLSSPAIPITGYTNLQLSFRQDLWQFGTDFTIFLETSSNGTTWTPRYTYANPPDFTETRNVDISAEDGNNTLYFRFRFTGDSFDLFSWSIDDIIITGDSPPITPQITWLPVAGLYTDPGLTTVYISGSFTDTVYAAPNGTQTYTATDQNGCSIDATVTRNKKVWTGVTSNNWYDDSNWFPLGMPTALNCVVIPDVSTGSTNIPILNYIDTGSIPLPPTTPGYARNLTVDTNAFLDIQPDSFLLVTDWIDLNGTMNIRNTGSLIQITDGASNINNNTGSGIMNMERTVTFFNPTYDYIYWSSPTDEDFIVTDISSATGELIYEWDTTIGGSFGNWIPASGTMLEGKGYIVRSLGTSTPANTAIFNGIPNNGVINTPIDRGTYGMAPGENGYFNPANGVWVTPNDDNWNLVGNPYPSAISADAFIALNASIIDDDAIPVTTGAVYLWRHLDAPSNIVGDPFYGDFVYNYDAGNYTSYNGTGSSPHGFTGEIAAGQAFFVLAEDVTLPASITFNNTMRSITLDNGQFFRTDLSTNVNSFEVEKHRIWLDLIKPNNTASSILVGYVEGATNNQDRIFDAVELSETSTRFYSLIGEEKMAILGKSLPFSDSDTVPLGLVIPESGNYTIAINTLDGLFEIDAQDIYLEDTYSEIIHDLRIAPYSFNIDAGTYDDRFILRYTNNSLTIEEFESNSGILISAPNNNYIKVYSEIELIERITIYNVLGQILYNTNNINESEIIINNITDSDGVLFIKATLTNGQQKTQKVVIKN